MVLTACVLLTLAADKPLAGAVIVVDPGHGGQRYSRSYTGGTRGVHSRLTESELNLRVALALVPKLEAAGATVHLTRTYDRRLSREGSTNADELHARIDYFDRHNPHFFVSIHHNAGGAKTSGHTALYKHNAADDTLYKACAAAFNDALEGAVQGPKLKLIKGSYHILRETDTPGTITEAGFQTNPGYDADTNTPGYPDREAAALLKGATAYWAAHRPALEQLRGRQREPKPSGPITATDLDPQFQADMAVLLGKVAPGGRYDAGKAAEYVAAFKGTLPDPTGFAVTAATEGGAVKLAGSVSDRSHHDRLIDLFVAMKLVALDNAIKLPAAKK